MFRFFSNNWDEEAGTVTLSAEDSYHMMYSLRVKKGECVEVVCDLRTFVSEYYAWDEKNKTAILKILSEATESHEPKCFLRLFQGLTKGQKLDTVIQKSTEIGVSEIIPLEMKRSISKIKNEKMEDKLSRWNKIAYEAAKQSKREVIPRVLQPMSFSELMKSSYMDDFTLVPYECENENGIQTLLRSRPLVPAINILIGPEGGIDPSEVEMLRNQGAKTVSLGKRILRTETAGIITAAIVLYEYGEME